ncbi:MAG: hypothetical protein ACE5R6_19330 [Candidatus Heimdallarchaeota archaeon]
MYRHDILIVGGSLANLCAAIEANRVDTAIISYVYPFKPHSGTAQHAEKNDG